MIPYLPQPALHIGPLTVHAFGIMVVIAIIVGHGLTARRANRHGYDPKEASDFVVWIIVIGFLISHVIEVVFYKWDALVEEPLMLFRFWEGISSWGGWFGAITGGVIVAKIKRLTRGDTLRLLDFSAYAVPTAWVFGRAGCALAHDHPSRLLSALELPPVFSWLNLFAIRFPPREPRRSAAGTTYRSRVARDGRLCGADWLDAGRPFSLKALSGQRFVTSDGVRDLFTVAQDHYRQPKPKEDRPFGNIKHELDRELAVATAQETR